MKQPPVTVQPGSCAGTLPEATCHTHPTGGLIAQGAILTNSRWIGTLSVLSLMAMAVSVLCLHFGTQSIAYHEILRVCLDAVTHMDLDGETSDVARTILLHVRLPRMLLGFLIGCSLATVGVALQALLRN